MRALRNSCAPISALVSPSRASRAMDASWAVSSVRVWGASLPYVVGTPACYGFAGFNGRTRADNAPEAMLSLVAGMAVPSGLRPSVTQQQRSSDFPYVVPA